MAPQPIPVPAPTPGPEAAPGLNPTPVAFDERDQIVTVLSTAAAATSSTSSSGSSSASLIGPIVGGLVGGIAAGLLIAGIWYYCARKSQREKEEARLRYQRRKAKRQQQQTRPSASSSRQASATKLVPQEKEYSAAPVTPISAVPTLPKNTYDPYKIEQGYGYATAPPSQLPAGYQYGQDAQYGYNANPNAAYEEHQNQYNDPNQHYQQVDLSADDTPTVPAPAAAAPPEKKSKSSRGEKRVAAAEQAAAAAAAPISERHRPNKPSPLALAREQEARDAAPKWGEGPFRSPTNPISPSNYGDAQETLEDERDRYLSAAQTKGIKSSSEGRATSGEWGVALGSPNHDGTFADQQGQQATSDSGHSYGGHRPFAADPYLSAASNQTRAPSGQYTSDPYASYHDDSKAKKSWI